MAHFTIEIFDQVGPDGKSASRILCSANPGELKPGNLTDAGMTLLKIMEFLRDGCGGTADVHHAKAAGVSKETGEWKEMDLLDNTGDGCIE